MQYVQNSDLTFQRSVEAYQKAKQATSDNTYIPSVTVPPYQQHPSCPHCGRCPNCGRGGYAYPSYPSCPVIVYGTTQG